MKPATEGPTLVTKMEWHRAARPDLPHVLVPLWPRVRRSMGRKDECGVYFLLRGPEVVYIGQSEWIPQRLRTHRRRRKAGFDEAWYIRVPSYLLDAVETALILLAEPRGNARDCRGRIVTPRRPTEDDYGAAFDFLGERACMNFAARNLNAAEDAARNTA